MVQIGDWSQRIDTIKEHILQSNKVANADKTALKFHLDNLVEETRRDVSAALCKKGNPAVVGLAGFGVSTMLLQFHNFGWMKMTPVIWTGMAFGGGAQMIAGLLEFFTGNNFAFCAFSTYGAFWISFALIQIDPELSRKVNSEDVGFFLISFTIYTFILFITSTRVSFAMASLIGLTFVGFVILDIAQFHPADWLTKLAGAVNILCAWNALYIMAHFVYLDTFKFDVLPVGPPLHEWKMFQRFQHRDSTSRCCEINCTAV